MGISNLSDFAIGIDSSIQRTTGSVVSLQVMLGVSMLTVLESTLRYSYICE